MKAVYPGTFDPITFGHLDVIKRGVKLFRNLVVAVAENPKKEPLFSVDERVQMIRECVKGMDGVEVKAFDSLLVDFLRKEKASVVLRGLRETSDFPAEFQQALTNRLLDSRIETVFVMTSAEHFYVTSSIVKEIAGLGGQVDKFVPPAVKKKLTEKLFR